MGMADMTREEEAQRRELYEEFASSFLERGGIQEGEPISIFIPDASRVTVFVLDAFRRDLAEADFSVELKEWPCDASPTLLEISKASMLEN